MPATVPFDEVRRAGRLMARRWGLDPDDGESLALQAWWQHPDCWRTVARRDCIDLLRHEHGDKRNLPHPPPIPVDPQPDDGMTTPLDGAVEEPGYAVAEDRACLADLLAGLDDADLATLARVYWLGLPFRRGDVAAVRALRHARRPNHTAQRPLLTEVQTERLRLLANGLTLQEIAETTRYSHPAIKRSLSNVYALLNARNAAHAVAIALRAGLI